MKVRRIIAILVLAAALPAAANITSTSLRIQGAGLKVVTESVTTGIDMPTTVQTEFGGKRNDEAVSLEGVTAVGELIGPGLDTPIQLATAPGHKFQIPGLARTGVYYLQNVRMMKDGEFLQYATPAVATIHVADLLQTKVSVKQLSPDQLRERGITVDTRNYDVFEYSFTFIVDGKEVVIPFPVIIDPRTREVYPIAKESPYVLPSPKLIEPPRWTPPTIIPMEFGEEGELPEPGKEPLPKEPKAGRPRIPAAIVIPNSMAVLHQFFAVGLMVTNGAPAGSDARLEDLQATIRIPTALRTVKTTPAVSFGQPVPIVEPKTGVTFLVAQGRGEAEWILEGLQPGTHRIDFELKATLRQNGQEDVPMRATPSTAIVIHDPRFNINFSHPDTVRKGLEYSTFSFITNMSGDTQTITVTSDVQPCDVNPNANACRLNGAQSDALTIPPGEMRVIEYRLRAGITGHVFATAGTIGSEENLKASVHLHQGVSESGIPLSPATLIMPYYAQFVDSDIVSANLQLFGLGYSLATAPVNAMTAKFPRVIRTDVFQRAVDIARAGQRIFITDSNAESKRDTLSHLALDLLGNGGHELREWDALRRSEKSGRSAGASVIRQLEVTGLANNATMSAFVDAFANATAHRQGYVAALAHGLGAGDRPYAVSVVGRTTERRSAIPNEAAEGWVRDIPFSDVSRFNGNGEKGELALVARWTEDLDVKVTPAADGAFAIELIYPNTNDGTLQRAHFDVTNGKANETITITLTRGAASLNAMLPNGGVAATGTVRTVSPAPLRILGARQDLYLEAEGHKVSLLYSRPMKFQDGLLEPKTKYKGTINFDRDGLKKTAPRPISSAVLQEDGRTVNLTFDHTLSQNATYEIEALAIVDPTTSQEVSFPDKVIPKIDNDKPAGILYGKVVKGDNTPIAKAEVTIRQYLPGDGRDPSGLPQYDLSADEDGSFLFEYVRRQSEAGYSGAYRLSATATDGKTATIEGSVRLPGKVHVVNIQFLGRGAAEGYVRYNDGSVVKDAAVVVGSTMFDQFRTARTDANGYYRVEDLPVGPLTFSATDSDGNVTFAASEVATPGQLVTQNLSIFRKPFPGTGRVYGVVRRSDTNQPVANAHVGVYSQGYGLTDAYTDADGRFDFPKVPAGFVTLLASEWSVSRQAVSLDFDLRADEVRPSDLLLNVVAAEKTTSMTGKVMRENPLQPGVYEAVPGALVKIDGYRIVTADDKGEFRYDDLPLSFKDKNITAYDPATKRVSTADMPDLFENQLASVTIFIKAFDHGKGTIRVRVLNAAGNPVSGYRVLVPGFPPDLLPQVGPGVYELKDIGVGATYEIWAVPSQGRPTTGTDTRPYGDQYAAGKAKVEFNGHIAALTLRLPGQGTVRVKVRSQFDLITPVNLTYSVWDEAEQNPYPLTLTASTEKNGDADWAVFTNIPALANYSVSSAHPQYGYAGASAQLAYNGDSNDHVLQLNTLAIVRGQVLAIDGLTPVAGATVTISNGRSDPGPRVTGPDGRFEFVDQPSSTTVYVTAQITQSEIYRTGIASGKTPPNGGVVENVNIVLRKRGFVDGRVVYRDYKKFDPDNPANNIPDDTPGDYSDNAPVKLAKFYLRELDFPHRTFGRNVDPLTADVNGRFVLNHVFVGSLRATAWDPGNEELRGDWTGSISEEGAEASPKAYIAVYGGTGGVGNARVTVVDPNQSYAAVQNAEVAVYNANGARFDFSSTDATGSVEFTELPAARYYVSAYSKALGKTSKTEEIIVVRDGVAAARLELEFSGKVDGSVVDPDDHDRPIPGAHVRLTASNYSTQATTDAQGLFLFEGVREGWFALDVKDTDSNRRDHEERTLTVLDPHRTVKLELEHISKLYVKLFLPTDDGRQSDKLAPPANIEVTQRCWYHFGVRHCDYVRELQGNNVEFTGALLKEGYGVTIKEIGGLQRTVSLGGSFPTGGSAATPFTYTWPAYGDVIVTVNQGTTKAQGAKVSMSGPGKSITVYTDATGTAIARGMQLGRIYIQATSFDGKFTGSAVADLAKQSEPATASITLGTYGGVTGRVLAELGGVSEGTRVRADFAGNVAEMRTDAEGRYTILGIPAVGNGTTVNLTFIGPDDATPGGYRSAVVAPNAGIVTVPDIRLDATPPLVESILPEDGSGNVSPDSSITITFSEPLNTGTINGSTFQLLDADGAGVSCSFNAVERSDGKFVVTMRPPVPSTGFPLKSNTLYRVLITSGVRDTTGHALPSTRAYTFTTSDYAEPRVQKVMPASPIPRATTFEFRFNEPIDPAPWQTGGNGTFRIYKLAAPGGAGAGIIGELSGRAFVDPATNMTLFIAPGDNSPIQPESYYRVTFNGVRDPQGNPLAEQTYHFFSFDETAPHVVFTAPPASDQLISGAEYELRIDLRNGSTTGTVATDVAKVEYFTIANDNSEIPFASVTKAPFYAKILGPDAPESGGTLKVGAQAIDTSGNRGPKTTATWSVKPNAAPKNVVVTPAQSGAYPSNKVSANVTFEDEGTFVSITTSFTVTLVNGTESDAVTLTQSYSRNANGTWPEAKFTFTLPLTAKPGANATFRTTVADVRGLVSAQATATTTIAEDLIQPVIVSTKPPAREAYAKAATYTIEAVVRDDETTVQSVSFLVDGKSVAVASSTTNAATREQTFRSVAVTVPPKAEDTNIPIVITAKDYNNNTRSTTFDIVYKGVNDPDAPKVTWLCPVDGAAIPAERDNYAFPVRVRAIDQDITSVTFTTDAQTQPAVSNVAFSAATNEYSATLTFAKTPAAGTLNITAVVKDTIEAHTVELPVAIDLIKADFTYTDPKAILASDVAQFTDKTIALIGSGAVLAPQVPVRLANLLVLNGARVETLPTTIDKEYRLDLTVTGVAYVDCDSRIDVSERGYLGGWGIAGDVRNDNPRGRTAGNTNTAGADSGSQGSHAGLGGNAVQSVTNAPYGSITQPVDLGSGGGGSLTCCTAGASGGGAIALHGGIAESDLSRIVILGAVRADGGWGLGQSVSRWAAGSGGSIWIDGKEVLFGLKTRVSANGGDDDGDATGSWGGGGGRISIAATTKLDAANAVIEARGGRNANTPETATSNDGGAGTILIRKPGQERGDLIVSDYDSRFPSTAHLTRPTPLGRIGRGTSTAIAANALTDSTRTFDRWMIGEELTLAGDTARTFTVTAVSSDGKTLQTDPADGSLLSAATSQTVVYEGLLAFDSVTAGKRALLVFDNHIRSGSAVNDRNAMTREAGAVVVLRNDVPTITTSTNPAPGGSVIVGNNFSFTFDADSDAGVGRVNIKWSPVAGDKVESFTSYPASAERTVSIATPDTATLGPATVTATAIDRAGRTVTSAPITLQLVTNQPPVVNNLTIDPVSLEIYPGRTVKATVTATDDLAVRRITLNGTLGAAAIAPMTRNINTATAVEAFDIPLAKDLAGGTLLKLRASVEDLTTGHSPVLSDEKTITVLTDSIAPQVAITSPLSTTIYNEGSGAMIQVRVTATDAEVDVKQVSAKLNDGTPVAMTRVGTTNNWQVDIPVPSVQGTDNVPMTIAVTATDYNSNNGSGSVTFNVKPNNDPNAPVVAWACSSPNAMYPAGHAAKLRLYAKGANSSNGVSKVEFYINGSTTPVLGTAVSGLADHFETTYTIPSAADGTIIEVIGVATSVSNLTSDTLTKITVVADQIHEINGNTIIDSLNAATFTGKTVVVKSGTVTIDAPITPDRLLVLGGSIWQRANDASVERRIQITAARGTYIACGAYISASERGYQTAGLTWPNTTTGGSAAAAGGSHGGRGGHWFGNQSALAYGSIMDPNTPGGAGGGSCCNAGGGIVRLKAKTLTIDGGVYSNGQTNYSGGAGGSIRLDADVISGAGEVRAEGGQSNSQDWTGHSTGWRYHGAGGGGRIAMYFQTLGLTKTSITTASPNSTQATRGATGTVYLRTVDASGAKVTDELIFDQRSMTNEIYTDVVGLGTGTVTAVNGNVVTLSASVPAWIEGSMIEFTDAAKNLISTYAITARTSTSVTVALPQGETAANAPVGSNYRGYWAFDRIIQRNSAQPSFRGIGGKNVTLQGTIVTPFIRAENLTLTGATISHLQLERLDVNVVNNLTIDAASQFTASGMGYQDYVSNVGRTYPNTFTNGSIGWSGGSHGGYGGAWFSDTVGHIYGSLYDPDTYGAAGGSWASDCWGCTSGGGIIRIKAKTATVDGKILSLGNNSYTGGAGGSIRIDAETLQGTGEIRADGGYATVQDWTGHGTGWRYHGSGGGGRVAIYTQSNTFNKTKITAASPGATEATRGGPGTVYLRSVNAQGATVGEELIYDNRGDNTPTPARLVRLAEGTVVAVNGNVITLSKAFEDGVLGSIIEILDANGNVIASYEIIGVTANTVTVRLASGETAANAPVGSAYRGAWSFANIIQRNGGYTLLESMRTGDVTLTGTYELTRFTAKNLTLNGSITHTYGGRLELTVAETLRIPSGSSINVSGKGYVDTSGGTGRTWPNTFTGGNVGLSGGSHGGRGGNWFGDTSSKTYGSLFDPNTPGSAGGCGWSDCWGATSGGGIVRIKAGTLELGGGIYANGNSSRTGGAGGSIRIDAHTISGAGEVRADGGRAWENTWTGHGTGWMYHGSGGGGRIAIYYNVLGLDRAKITAGIDNPTYATGGGAGTIYLKSAAQQYGELIVDTKGQGTPGLTTLPAISYGKVTSTGSTAQGGATDIVYDANASLLSPDHFRGVRLFLNGNQNLTWPIKSNTATSLTVDVSANALNAQVGDSYRGLYQFDAIKLRNARVVSFDEIKSMATPDKDSASSINSNSAPPAFNAAKLASIVVESSASGDFVVAPATTVDDTEKPITIIATNVRTGQQYTANAAADGSFRVTVAGNVGDTFTVRARDAHLEPATSAAVPVNGAIREYNSLTAFTLDKTSVSGGTDVQGSVRLVFQARSGGSLVSLTSSDPAVQVPSSVPVLAGTTSAAAVVKTSSVNAPVNATITATLGTSTITTTLNVLPAAAGVTSVALSQSTVEGGTSINGTVVLGAPAGAGGALVSLATSDTRLAGVPDTVLVAEGNTSASFPITTSRVGAQAKVTIRATYVSSASAEATLSACVEMGVVAAPASIDAATLWLDDTLPAGATQSGNATIDSTQFASGSSAIHLTGASAGTREFTFTGATSTLTIGPNEKIVFHALVNPCNPPKQLLIGFKAGATEYRASWGEHRLDVTTAQANAGILPAGGVWTRLEVSARMLGITSANVSLNALTIRSVDGELWIDAIGKSSCGVPPAAPPVYGAGEQVWMDDAVPPGAVEGAPDSFNTAWSWDTSIAASGTRSHKRPNATTPSQHYWDNANPGFALSRSDVLFTYVYLDPCNPPRQVIFQWNSGGWNYRAYWGDNTPSAIGASRVRMGALPETGKWVRLEVPAVAVGLAGRTVTGMSYSISNGQAWFDRTGKVARVNVAYGKATRQSTDYSANDPSSRAVDGNIATGHGSMSVTAYTNQAWWEVDLGAVYPIDTVDIYGRTDCCTGQTGHFWVIISDTAIGNPANLDAALATPGARAYGFADNVGALHTINVRNTGRYIRIHRSGTEHLSIPEVEVWTPSTARPVNLATGTRTYSTSSVHTTNYAFNALNGDHSERNQFSHTNSEVEPFYEVDLGSIQPISTIDLASRFDGYGSQMFNMYVLVSDTPFVRALDANLAAPGTSVFYYRNSPEQTTTHSIAVHRRGRYVRLQKAGTDFFSINELSIWGQQPALKPLSQPDVESGANQ